MKTNNTKISWSFYDFAVSAYSVTVVATVIQMFLSLSAEAANITGFSAAIFFSCVTSLSAFLLLIAGVFLSSPADLLGRKKIIIIFIAIGSLSTILIALTPINNYYLILFLYLLSFVCYESSRIFYDSMIFDAAEENNSKSLIEVSSFGVLMGHLGGVIVFITSITIILLAQMELIEFPMESAFKIVFVISGIWWIAFSIPLLLRYRQKHQTQKKENIFIIIKRILNNRNICIFLIAYFLYIGAVGAINTQFIDTAVSLSFGTVTLSFTVIIIHLTAILFTFLYAKATDFIGVKRTIMVGIASYALACVYLTVFKNSLGFYVVAFIIGTAQGGIFALSRVYYAEMIQSSNATGYFAIYHIIGKFAVVAMISIIAIINFFTASHTLGFIVLLLLFISGGFLLFKHRN